MAHVRRFFRLTRLDFAIVGIGILLRLALIWFPRPSDDDTSDYLQLGYNLLHHGIYGLGTGNDIAPTLFRLPGYPVFLAIFQEAFAGIFPDRWQNVIFAAQAIADIAGVMLLAAFATRHISARAGKVALLLGMICPFTAAYAGIALTECLSVFAISLGLYACGRALAAEQAGRHDIPALLLTGFASALAMLLRPDGAILLAVLAVGLVGYTARVRAVTCGWRRGLQLGFESSAICCLAPLLLMTPWIVRNWMQFRTFQPLAPRYLNDPGERFNAGFYRWMRTWSTEFVNTADVFWSIGEDTIDPGSIPQWAFDSPKQRLATLQLIEEYNRHKSISADLDSRFDALASERVRAHPLRYYLWIPCIRVVDMTLRPRTGEFYLEVYWWDWETHPGQTALALLLGLVNLAYVLPCCYAFARGQAPWPWILGGYLLLRFALLGTMENPEPRYTLECFPIFILGAASMLSRIRMRPVPDAVEVFQGNEYPTCSGTLQNATKCLGFVKGHDFSRAAIATKMGGASAPGII